MNVGDTVYLKSNNSRGNQEIQEYKIKKKGRKYLEVWKDKEEYTTIKFNLDDFTQVTNYTPDWKLYFSKQQILDEEESNELTKYIREQMGQYSKSKLNLWQLRKIRDIIQGN